MANPTFRQVESWRWILAHWLSMAGMQLSRWWLDKSNVPPGYWLFGAAVRVPFSEEDEHWLRAALADHPEALDFRRQLSYRRFLRRERGTQLAGGAGPGDGERPAWNHLFRPGAADVPWTLPSEPHPNRPFRCMGVAEFKRRLAAMLGYEGARVHSWREQHPDFFRQTTMVVFYVVAPFAAAASWRLEGGGLSRADYVRGHPSSASEELAGPAAVADAAAQTDPNDSVPRGVVIEAAANVQAERVNAGRPMSTAAELRAERRAWRRTFRKRPRSANRWDRPYAPPGEWPPDLPSDMEGWSGSGGGSQAEESSVEDDFRAEPTSGTTPKPAIPPGFGRSGEGPSDLPPGFGG